MFRRGDEERHDNGPIQPVEVRGRDQAGAGEVTVVGKGARLEGNLVSAGALRIDGQVKGTITADGDVTLSPNSQVQADVKATNVVVAGRFKGNILASNRAELARGGRVDGNITSKTLVVAEGAVFCGQSLMDGEAPGSRQAAQAVAQQAPADRKGQGQPAAPSAQPSAERAPAR